MRWGRLTGAVTEDGVLRTYSWPTQAPPKAEHMPDTYNYPAEIERDEDGRYVVSFPDFGWGATDGATRDEALLEAKDLLRELIATTMREGENLPKPSRANKRRPLVVPPLQIALKDLGEESGLKT